MDIDNGFELNLDAIRAILLSIFENKPDFPIESKDVLVEALGGKDHMYYINENVGQIPASALAERSFQKTDNIEEPNQIIDALLGDSFINIFTKYKFLETIMNLQFPIESKDKFTIKTKDLITYGLPIETIADKMDYPINKPEQIINRLKLIDQKLIDAKIELISNIKDSEIYQEIISKEPAKVPDEKESEEVELKEKIKDIIAEGKEAYREKQYERAIEIYDRGLELEQDNTEILFLKKSVQAKLDDIAKGSEKPPVTEKPIEKEPSEPEIETVPEPPITAEVETEVQAEAQPEAQPEPETQPDAQAAAETEPEIQPDAEAPMETEPETQPEAQAPAETEPEAPTEPEPQMSSEPEPETSTDDAPATKQEEFNIEDAKYDVDNDKLEEMEKRLKEKVKALQSLSAPTGTLSKDACSSCEGIGDCYWCKGSGKCVKCSGSGKIETGGDCPDCGGSGNCHSCKGAGKCHWCQGSGKKKS
jgi:hypothetical protein